MEIFIRNKSGQTVHLQIEELLEIDGKPYRGSAEVNDRLVALETQVAFIQSMVFTKESPNGGN